MVTMSDTEAQLQAKIDDLHSEPISRQYFVTDKSVTVNHVRCSFGTRVSKYDAGSLQALASHVDSVKKDATTFGCQKVERQIVLNMRDLGHDVMSWKNVLVLWKNNGDSETAACIWESVHGWFDKNQEWSTEWETEYMKLRNLAYKNTNEKGCFARLFSACKCTRVKALNRASSKTHGGKIFLQRDPAEIDEGTKFRKREKGTTLGAFAKDENGDQLHNPKQYLVQRLKQRTERNVSWCVVLLCLQNCLV